MTADDDVFDFKDIHGEEDDRLDREIVRGNDIGDVAVNKNITRLGAANGGLRAARVGAAEPEERRGLAFCKSGEEVGFAGRGILMPFLVVGEEFVESVFRGHRRRFSRYQEMLMSYKLGCSG